MKFGKEECQGVGAILGHKFSPRYDYGAPDLSKFKSFRSDDQEAFFEAMKPKSYVHDVCERCGFIIKR